MKLDPGRIVIIGGGIAGLCAAVYARKCGYEVELVEQHESLGGLATSWRRGDYTFETCLHWLLGSNPARAFHAQWHEVFDISRLRFVYPEEFVRLETEQGEQLRIFTDLHRLEHELLEKAPQDAAEIRHLIAAAHELAKVDLPNPGASWFGRGVAALKALPHLPLLGRLSDMSCRDYGRRFTHPLLRNFFGDGEMAELSALPLVFSLAWMSQRDAGYAIGGSQAIIRAIRDTLLGLGGRIWLGSRVARVMVEQARATGVELADGQQMAADWVLSAADGHATIYDLLGGRYTNGEIDRTYNTLVPFPSYLQVSLGVARDLSGEPWYLTRVLDRPLLVDPSTALGQIAFRFFHFDPTFAPKGKTAVTCVLPTRDFRFWTDLHEQNPQRYEWEKRRIGDLVSAVLDRAVPGVRSAIEVVDVATPATVIRYTGNWKGSMEGWLLTAGMGFAPLPNTLPGLERFVMAGQWVMPGGGLPSGLVTARTAVQAMCKADRIAFLPKEHLAHAGAA